MKRWAAFGILAGSMFVLSGSCQGPDAFYGPLASGSGGSGVGGSGFGGFIGVGIGGSGLGGFGVGGRGNGGTIGAGGRGTGGATGTGGMTGIDGGVGTGGMTGVDGGVGTGGRMFDAGSGCVATMISNGYAAGTATPCSQCRENQLSRATLCMAIIDCIAPLYPCTGCFTDCSNQNGGSGPVNDCVRALMTAACGP